MSNEVGLARCNELVYEIIGYSFNFRHQLGYARGPESRRNQVSQSGVCWGIGGHHPIANQF
jgi:hypothetical protein